MQGVVQRKYVFYGDYIELIPAPSLMRSHGNVIFSEHYLSGNHTMKNLMYFLIALVCHTTSIQIVADAAHPNVILIMTDDQGTAT